LWTNLPPEISFFMSTSPIAPTTFSHSLFTQGYAHFTHGHYFEAHEVWEDLWRQLPPDESCLDKTYVDKTYVHACIQLAVALHHRGKGNMVGFNNLLTKAGQKFVLCQPSERYQLMVDAWQHTIKNTTL
jgi:uncharacterized protein